jgi:hypothetical protein
VAKGRASALLCRVRSQAYAYRSFRIRKTRSHSLYKALYSFRKDTAQLGSLVAI